MRIINAMVRALASAGVHPNILTTIGVLINVGCGVLFGIGEFFWAGIVLIVANLFDMLDGNVARLTGNVTKFGGFLDSSLDRVSDLPACDASNAARAGHEPHYHPLSVRRRSPRACAIPAHERWGGRGSALTGARGRAALPLRGEPGASLRPSPEDDPATGARAHAGPEAVGLLPVAVVRLERAFHRVSRSGKTASRPCIAV